MRNIVVHILMNIQKGSKIKVVFKYLTLRFVNNQVCLFFLSALVFIYETLQMNIIKLSTRELNH